MVLFYRWGLCWLTHKNREYPSEGAQMHPKTPKHPSPVAIMCLIILCCICSYYFVHQMLLYRRFVMQLLILERSSTVVYSITHAFTVKGYVYLHTKLFTYAWTHLFQSLCMCIPVIKEPFTKIIGSGWSESCIGGSSHSWLWVIFVSWPAALWKQRPPLTLTNKPWSVSICWISLVWSTGGKHPYTEYCTPVEDMTEWQDGQRVSEKSQEPEGHKFDPCEEAMWLSRAVTEFLSKSTFDRT